MKKVIDWITNKDLREFYMDYRLDYSAYHELIEMRNQIKAGIVSILALVAIMTGIIYGS